MFNRFFLIALATVTLPLASVAQAPTFQDCLGAIPVCLNSYSTGNVITGTGNVTNEINAGNSCLLTGERNDAWYIITTGSAGNLNISIIPNNLAHNYDWAIYNLTASVCSDIFSNASLEVACNYSNLPGITGPNGLAGAQNNPVISVNAGQTYLINVSGFSTINQAGYTIDLSNSTATITDNTPPVLSGLTAMNCGATTMVASFSERVLCSSVQPSDFTLTGPGGPFTVNTVTNNSCSAGATYARDYSVSFSPAIPGAGLYTLSLVNPVSDLCSNNSIVPQAFPVPISGVSISFNKVDVTCYGGNNGSVTAVVSGPPGPYTYQWSPSGGNGVSAQWLTVGTYTVTVTSPLGCTGQATVTINQPLTGLTASVATVPANGCAANGSATVTVSNGQGPFTYNWWPTGGNGATANNLSAGSYMVTITDANQCVLNYFFNIPSGSGPTVNISNFSGVSCYGGNDGTATVNVNGATGPFTYQWSPSGGNAATATGLTAGNYTVTVTVAPGCTLTAVVAIVQPPAPVVVQVASVNTACGNNNGSVTLNASGGTGTFSYQWFPNVSTGSSASGLAGGTYTVTVSDGNGCSVTNSIQIQLSSQPQVSLINHQDVSCFGLSDGATGISVTGGAAPFLYQWSSGQTGTLLNNIPAGTYTVTVTDAGNCTASVSDIVLQPSQVTASIGSIQQVNCFGDNTGGATILTNGGSGGNTWSWTGTASSTSSISNVATGTYTATVTDLNGCSSSVQVNITGPNAPLNIIESIVQTTCGNNDGSITVAITGGTSPYSLLWNTGASGFSLNSLFSGIYTLTVTDQNGCTGTLSVTLQSTDAPVITINSVIDVTCNGGNNGSAMLSVAGGISPHTWAWQGSVASGPSASGLSAGNYNVTVTDASGCSSFQQVTISAPAPLTLPMSIPATICTGGTTIISGTPSGGSQPYAFAWSNGNNTNQISVNPTATTSYTLTVTDSHGCIVNSNPVIITVLPPLSVTATYPDSVCKGNSAVVSFTAAGGDNNYDYNWNNGMMGSVNTLIIFGDTTFTVVLTDGCGSASVASVINIIAVNPPAVSMILSPQSGCAPLSAQFAVPSGWPPSYNYLWNFGDGYTSSLASTSHIYKQEGLYTVTLSVSYSSAIGCSTLLQFPDVIDVKGVPSARFIFEPTQPTLNHPDVYFADRSTGAISWYWTFGDGSPENREQNVHHVYSDTGAYIVWLNVESPDGCTDSTYQIVTVEDELQVFIPNAFTPNSSGVNDYFKVYGVGMVSYELFIFDKWGKLIHTAKNREEAWDGTNDNTGEQAPEGLYVYKVTIIDNAGNIHNRFNHVTIIR